MRIMRKTRLALLVLVSILIIGPSVYACGKCGSSYGTERGYMGKTSDLSNIPNLTSKQTQQIQKLQQGFQKESGNLQLQLQTKQLELQTLINDNAEQTKIDAKVGEISSIRSELMQKGIAYRQKIRKVLTDEQKAYFDLHGVGSGNNCYGCHL